MKIPSISISERYELSKKILESEKRCFHPDAPDGCSPEGPIKSHSVSKGMSLAAIAERGCVISTTKPFNDIVLDDSSNVKPSGVNISSIFPGFCRNHDNRLFASIETDGWNLSREACFLLSYRSLSNTVLRSRTKLRYFEHMNTLNEEILEVIKVEGFSDEDIRKDYDFQIFAQRYLCKTIERKKTMEITDAVRWQYFRYSEMRAAAGSLNPHLKIAKYFNDEKFLGMMKEMFRAGNYESFRFKAFRYPCILPFVSSKTIKIRIQSEAGESGSFTTLNVCSNKKDSFIVFGWLEDGGIVKDYLDSLILSNEKEIINRLLGYIFKHPTNSFFQ